MNKKKNEITIRSSAAEYLTYVAAERKFYQKITDIYATSIDYDKYDVTIAIFLGKPYLYSFPRTQKNFSKYKNFFQKSIDKFIL